MSTASSPASPRGAARPPGTEARAAVAAIDVVKTFGSSDTGITALNDVSLTFTTGTFTAIMGPSGSGKSTLMHCLAGLDTIDSGSIRLADTELVGLSDRQLTLLRRRRVGFVFQTFNLLPTLTAEQNIRLPIEIDGGHEDDPGWRDRVVDALALRDRLGHRPSQLSGGQQQRVACARACVTRPDVVFADEPTGNLDSHSSAEVLSFLRMSVRELGQTVVMVTHDATAASYAGRVAFLRDGHLVAEMTDPSAEDVLESLKTLEH